MPTSRSQHAPGDISTTSSATFNHGNLSLRPNSISSQPQASQLDSQSQKQSATAVNPFNIQASVFKANPTDLERASAESTFERLGNGAKTTEDIQHYHNFNHYPARSIDGVEIDIMFALCPKEGNTFMCWYPLTLPASSCNTFKNLFNNTKDHWRVVFQQVGKAFPSRGIWAKNLTTLFQETHGDARGQWREAYRSERYEQWYRDHVIRGRVDRLMLQLIHTERVEE